MFIVTFIIFGREIAPETGTHHVQGYLELSAKKTLAGVKKLAGLGRAHLEPAKGTADDSIAYCSKEDAEPFRAGEPYCADGGESGRDLERKRWSDALDAAKRGDMDEIPADIYLRCKRSFDEIAQESKWKRSADSRPRIPFVLRPWQFEALNIVEAPVDDRAVHFFVDPKGGAGKSFFCQHILRDVPDVLILRPGRSLDLAYILREPPRVVVFDCPRSSSYSDIPWEFIESLKDGYIVSTKYAGIVKDFSPATVLVMCNTELWKDAGDVCALSSDRMHVHEISE